MKTTSIIITLLLAVNYTYSQNINIPEPEWEGYVVYVNDSIGNGLELEKQKAYSKTNANASLIVTGLGKVKARSCVNGGVSNVIIHSNENLQFIVKHSSNKVDPRTIINLFKLESDSKKRCAEVASLGSFSGSKTMDIDYIQFTAKKYGETSYLITIASIDDGEYALTLENTREVFNLFSIQKNIEIKKSPLSQSAVEIGDTVWFKKYEEWMSGKVLTTDYYGVKLEYHDLQSNKTKQKHVDYPNLKSEYPNQDLFSVGDSVLFETNGVKTNGTITEIVSNGVIVKYTDSHNREKTKRVNYQYLKNN